jgi:hypothetical protein
MKASALACLAVLVVGAVSNAQAPSRRPDQFYTNGESINAWTAAPQQRARTTFWFARHPADSAAYRQMLTIIYDSQPDQAYYIDSATRQFVGRLDLRSEQFSLLPNEARRARLQDINDDAFPAPVKLPRVADMFEPLPAGQRGNANQILLPPPTPLFPRLKNSRWETCYMSADRFQVRSILELGNEAGTYRLQNKPGTGRLSNVMYEREDENHLIQGQWALGSSSGWFKFQVPKDNLNVFWGEFGFEPGRIVGAWDGIRKPRPALKESQKRM